MTAERLLGPDHRAGRNLMRTAVRLLSRGRPITITELAGIAGVDPADLANAPAGQDIEYDDDRRIVGWGLTLNPTPHAFVVDGRRLYTWCAADTLMFPSILGCRAHVESTCPATGTAIRLTVDPATGVSDLSPATAVVSIPATQDLDDARVRSSCCNPGRFFATAGTADDWQVQQPRGTVLPVADAYPRLDALRSRLLD
jgi:alkylmercury lyase